MLEAIDGQCCTQVGWCSRLLKPTQLTHGSYSAAASAGQFPPRLVQPVSFLSDCIVSATIGGQWRLTHTGWCSRLLTPTSLTHDMLTGSAGGSAATCRVAGAACRSTVYMVVGWCSRSRCNGGSGDPFCTLSRFAMPLLSQAENPD